LIAGWLAGKVIRGGGFGLVGNIVIGVLGGLVGGWLATSVLKIGAEVNGINLESILVAFWVVVLLSCWPIGRRRTFYAKICGACFDEKTRSRGGGLSTMYTTGVFRGSHCFINEKCGWGCDDQNPQNVEVCKE
jgi:uncharacterized membrane protein YeaQ/YmgE (transglycosylase-associated protein family)